MWRRISLCDPFETVIVTVKFDRIMNVHREFSFVASIPSCSCNSMSGTTIAMSEENDSTLSNTQPHFNARSSRVALPHELARTTTRSHSDCLSSFPSRKEEFDPLHCAQERYAAFRRIMVGCISRSPLFTHLLLDNDSCFDYLIDTISTRLWDFHAPRARHISNE